MAYIITWLDAHHDVLGTYTTLNDEDTLQSVAEEAVLRIKSGDIPEGTEQFHLELCDQ